MQRVTARTSTIFIGIGDQTRVYRSMAEVPPPLRRKLRENTQSSNTVTIVIADQRGRMELAQIAKNLANADSENLRRPEPMRAARIRPRASKRAPRRLALRNWLELLLPLAVGASLWFFIDSRN